MHANRRNFFAALALAMITIACASAAEPDASLQEQLPRIPPTEPAAAEKTIQSLDGFRMQLIAAEPLVMDPVAMAYDEDGRAWVVEMSDYPYTDKTKDVAFQEKTADLPLGRVRILEDVDGDGKFDKSYLFADQLSWPTGIALYKGGAYVAGTPDIWYFKDTNGDRRADIRRKVFTGFRKFNVQAVINNLAWGLDNEIYGAGSSNGGRITSLATGGQPIMLSRADFRFSPLNEKFITISGGARFGNCFDDWGNRFVCNIRNPSQHVLLPSRYLARNPYLPVASAIHDVSEGGDNIPVYRISPPEPWRAVRAERWASEADGRYPRSETRAEGFITSTSGITVYRGSAYPARYRDNLFMGEVSGNLVHRQTLEPDGVTFIARRADPQTEFVRSTDNWFRPVNFVNAPDGTLHVLDMYRETIEHPWSIPDDIKAFLDLESGRDRGRLYRLAPPGFQVPKPPRLGSASTAELVAALANRNSWWRETAQRLLVERQDAAAAPLAKTLLRESSEPLGRLHALYTLAGIHSLDDDDLLLALRDSVPGVREHGVLLAEPRLNDKPALRERVLALADDTDVRVRFQVAFSLGEVQDNRAAAALATIGRRDSDDPWMLIAVLSSSSRYADQMLTDAVAAATAGGQPQAGPFVRQLATVIGGRGQPTQIQTICNQLASLPATPANRSLERAVILGLGDGLKRSRRSFELAMHGGSGPAVALVDRLLTQAAADARDPKAPLAARLESIGLLTCGSFERASGPLAELLEARQPQEIQMAAARALAGFNKPQITALLLERYRAYTPAMRTEVVELLLARSDRIGPLLDAVKQGLVSPVQISSTRKLLLLKHSDPKIRAQAAAVLGSAATSARKEVIAAYKPALLLAADPLRGQKVFERECRTCHRANNVGRDVGPNLASIRHRSGEEVMTQVLDPNREVAPNFIQYVVTIDDGRVTTGIIASETATSITLKRAEDQQETILRQNIEEIASAGTSLMPEGLEKKLSHQDMADLLRFLLGR
jgi:putative membrane-bound dehydrogenase-like protein